jgi:Cu+-exporting ATPase
MISNCVNAINSLLGDLQSDSTIISFTPLTLESPFIDVTYHPSPPIGFTLRSLRNAIVSLGPFTIFSIRATDTLDDLARRAQRKETRSLSIRLAITFIFAVPTFIIAMLGMAFLNPDNSFRRYLETPVWGSAPRGTICLFILATPVQFGVGSMFYERAWKGVRGVWRRDGPGRWKVRAPRFADVLKR